MGRRLVLATSIVLAVACGRFGSDSTATPPDDDRDATAPAPAPAPAPANGVDAATDAPANEPDSGVDTELPAEVMPLHLTKKYGWNDAKLMVGLDFSPKLGNRLVAVVASNTTTPSSVTVGGQALDLVEESGAHVAVSIWSAEVADSAFNSNIFAIELPGSSSVDNVAFARMGEWSKLDEAVDHHGASAVNGPAVVGLNLVGAGPFLVFSIAGADKTLGPATQPYPFFDDDDGNVNFVSTTISLVDAPSFEARWDKVERNWDAVAAAFPRQP